VPLDVSQTYVVAVPEYIAKGFDGFGFLKGSRWQVIILVILFNTIQKLFDDSLSRCVIIQFDSNIDI
jgi:hypothetical protein